MQTRNKSLHKTADTQQSVTHCVKSCPLCRTLNHALSRECFNCGWCGRFSAGDADVPGPCALRLPAFLSAFWRKLMLWLC